MLGVINMIILVPEIAGEDDSAKLADQLYHHIPIRMTENIHLINITAVTVIGQQLIHHAFNFLFKLGHIHTSLVGYYVLYHTLVTLSIEKEYFL